MSITDKTEEMAGYYSHAGYFGALAIVVSAFSLFFLQQFSLLSTVTNTVLFAVIGLTLAVMLLAEYFLQKRYRKAKELVFKREALCAQNRCLLKSTFWRFLALFLPFLFFYALVQNHYYFIRTPAFEPTRAFFDLLLVVFAVLGMPYIFLTLKYNGARRYEIGDYAILTMVGFKSFMKSLFARFRGKKVVSKYWRNRRVIKVLRLYLVNFFFLTLMVRFFSQEFHGFLEQMHHLFSPQFAAQSWYPQYKTLFLVIFHLLFTIDVGLAIIGYSVASRWLYNRTKSVDATLSGWMAALICYPPFNTITTQFFGYHGLPTYNLVTDERALAVILTLLIFLYGIYVWATAALGFRFSNLTNRGIVERGPYAIVRHPAYAAKNLAWWVDNTFVLTNIWATLAMAAWNIIYILRALTEERHLLQDKSYVAYVKKVKYRFIPNIV